MAVVSKVGENVVPYALRMLSALRHRGSEYHGLSTDKATLISKDIGELSELSRGLGSSVALGYNFRGILPEDTPQPIDVANLKVVFDGRAFSPPLDKDEIFKFIGRSGKVREALEGLIADMDGSFAAAVLNGSKLFAAREVMGTVPLYFCESGQLLALASERKALWALKVKDANIKSFPPGSIAELSRSGVFFRRVKVLERPGVRLVNDEELMERLRTLLSESIEERARGLGEGISLAFSGGLDSSVIAALMRRIGIKALLVSVGLEGSREIEHAESVAEGIGLPIKVETYTIEDVEESLPKVLWLIEEANALKASIHIPELWTAELSSKMGCRVLFCGHGGDELFGGYYKYLREYERSLEDAEAALYHDIISLHESSLEPSEKVCSFNGIEVRFPYVDYDLTRFALSVPINIKIVSGSDPLRKRVLRKFAEQIGLPPEVYLRPKKAIQYGTGVCKALRRIAKKSGLNMQELVSRVFRRIYSQYEDSNNLLA